MRELDGLNIVRKQSVAGRVTMTPERWQKVKTILSLVLEADPTERSFCLDKACADDPSLRWDVESFLLVEEQEKNVLGDGLPLGASREEDKKILNSRIGRRIGPYLIVEEIGVGGMGEVYRAFRADDQYRKEVAIKMICAGQDSKFVVARFKNERQALASLDHVNIARLLDGGTTEAGVPYLVMELIDGQPINEYCDRHRLAITDRLQMFLQVCAAVQFAHQRLIIHRDLKPSNILVTADGIPKLLDFGIAKVLDLSSFSECAEPTISMFRLLTPAYASPEQVNGEQVTTASDVYSLGVILYELLTGHRPYPTAGHVPHEIAQAVCEFEPEKPSNVAWRSSDHANSEAVREMSIAPTLSVHDGSPEKLGRRLRGDLDNIVLMALRKEPLRRYSSVEQMAIDIRRHLANLPVSASADTLRYRMSKFIRRHKGGVAAATALALTILTGLAATLYEAHQARVQQLRAERRFGDVRELANSLVFDLHDSIQDLPGATPARKLLVERALRYLDGLSRDSASDTSLQRELGAAYEKIGTVQGNPFGANLGDTGGALESYGKSLVIRSTLSRADPGNLPDRLAVARTQRLIAAILSNRGDIDSLAKLRSAAETAQQALAVAPSNPTALEEIEADYYLLAILLDSRGEYQGAAEYLEDELKIANTRWQFRSGDHALQRDLGRVETKLGYALARSGSRKEGLNHTQHGLELLEASAADLNDAESRRWLGLAHWMMGDILLLDGDARGALRSYESQRQIDLALATADPTNAVVQYDLGCATARVGNAKALSENTRGGLALLNRAANMFEEQIARDPAYVEPRFCLAGTLVWTGDAFVTKGQYAQALVSYQRALDIWRSLASHFEGTGIEADIAVIEEKVGYALMKRKKTTDASRELKQAIEIAETIATANPGIPEAQYAVAEGCFAMGELSRTLASNLNSGPRDQIQGWSDARYWYQRAAEAWRKISDPGARTPVGWACGNPRQVSAALATCERELLRLKAHNN